MAFFESLFTNYGVGKTLSAYLSTITLFLLLVLLCAAAHVVTKEVLHRLLANGMKRSNIPWASAFVKHKVLHKLSHIVPAVIVFYFAPFFPNYKRLIEKLSFCYAFVVLMLAFNALLNAIDAIYQSFEISKIRPIKGFIQVVKIIVFIVGGMTLVSVLVNKSPLILLSSLGALSAVLMLIFRDSILGFVAGIQLAMNDMVRVGDWVDMPKYDADGDVIEITLSTVKVQNWDKTITMVPSYAFISDSFKNWRGMQDAGGRRIKRAIYIDTTSIQFCTPQMIEHFQKIHYLTEYIKTKTKEISSYHQTNRIDQSTKANGRNLTNVGTFRTYIQTYLQHHPSIHPQMPIIVRQLSPNEHGLPLELYCFVNDTRWTTYETVQADIFDHIFAVAPEFGLRIFQAPSGYDLYRFSPDQKTNVSG